MNSDILKLKPIGFVSSGKKLKFDVPHQPEKEDGTVSVIELNKNQNYEQALRDLANFSHIWLIWWFHKNSNWRPMVLPPRGSKKRRGVFATRAPYRPNPIGITAVRLIKIEGLRIYISSHDLVDGTPILDIKPYLNLADSIPDASLGWLAEVEEEYSKPAIYKVSYTNRALEQINWLQDRGVHFITRAIGILERNPFPHRTRRIVKIDQNLYRMGTGAWRVFFSIDNNNILIQKVAPGYPEKLLASKDYNIPDQYEQIEFNAWECSLCRSAGLPERSLPGCKI